MKSMYLLLLLLSILQYIASEKCHKTLDSQNSLTTKILLREECNTTGKIEWLPQDTATDDAGHQHHAADSSADQYSPAPHIVQFRKAGQQSFTICLTFPDDDDDNQPFSVHQLRGKSRKHIRSSSAAAPDTITAGLSTIVSGAGNPVCIESQCSHVSLALQYQPHMTTTTTSVSPHGIGINYQFALDQRCPKCTDQCMKSVFCSSTHMFTGTVVSSELISQDGRGYKSIVKLDRYIKQDSAFTKHSGIKLHPSCNETTSDHHDIGSGGVVTIHSTCYLKLDKRYLISANYRAGLKNKGRLAVSCAQEDVEYGLHILQKLISSTGSSNNHHQCC